MKKSTLLTLTGVCVLAVAAIAFAQSDRIGAGRRGVVSVDRNDSLFPATEIIRYPDRDNSIGRLDTRTGAIYRWRGNVDNPSSRSTWERRVPPVQGETSGKLEIQQITARRTIDRVVTFLVDVENGSTWILRLRDNENGTWDPVPIYR